MKCTLKRLAVVTGLGLVLAGCDSPALWTSIYRTVPSDQTILTDAKQRSILNVAAAGGPGRNRPTRIVCAEPSPDVAQAVSGAISAAIKVEIAGKGGGAASFGRSAADAVAQLGERLGTIQLLRDGLYRACEAYANGAITSTTYAMIVSRYDDTMVTLLMGELAAGAFGRAGAAAMTAAGTGGASGIDPKVAEEKVQEAETKKKTLEDKIAKLENDIKDPKQANKKEGNEKELKNAKTELIVAKRDLAYNKAVLTLVRLGGAGTTALGVSATGVGGIAGERGKEAAETLKAMHAKFLEFDKEDLSPVVKACITTLDAPPVPANDMAMSELKSAIEAYKTALEKHEKSPTLDNEKQKTVAAYGLQNAAAKLGMTTWGAYCLTGVLPTVMDLAGKKLTKEQSTVQAKLETMIRNADNAIKETNSLLTRTSAAAAKSETAANKVIEQLKAKTAEKSEIRKFCIEYLQKGEPADKDTMKACLEALFIDES